MRKNAMPMMLVPQRFSRSFPILAAVILIIFLFTASRLRNGSIIPESLLDKEPVEEQPPPPEAPPPEPAVPEKPPINRLTLAPGQCAPEIDFLRRVELEFSDKILYSRRCIKPLHGKSDRDAVNNVTDPLVSKPTTVDLVSCSYPQPIPCEELPLPVSEKYPDKKFANFAFGVASKYDRLNDSVPAFAHWLGGTGAKIVGVVVDAEDPEKKYDLSALEKAYADAGVDAVMRSPRMKQSLTGNPEDHIPVEHHHFMLIRDIVEISTTETQWLGILDDDTFFPSLYPLEKALEVYDPSKPWWLGALSDDFGQVKAWGFMAFGGAGSIVSMPLAKQIEPFAEECIKERMVDTGDGMMRDCVYRHSRTHLTLLEGLYQHDFHGDPSGFYESGLRPLTVHHWKSWYREPMPQMAAVTKLCGDCFLERYRFDNNFLFVNGYSITQYPGGLDKIDLQAVEGTWPHGPHEFDFSYGTFRPRLEDDQKKSWRLMDIRKTENGEFHQIYLHRGNKEKNEMDEVIELVWPQDGA